MPRISVKKASVYGVYTLVGASLIMLALQQQQAWIWSLETQQQQQQQQEGLVKDPAPLAVEENEKPTSAENEVAKTDADVVNAVEPTTPAGYRWYMKDAGLRPIAGNNYGSVWPEENPGDRIEEQLMVALPDAGDVDVPDDEKVPLKKIYLPNGLSSWQVTGGRGLFLKQKCPVDRCVLTGRKEDAPTADAVMFKDYFTKPHFPRSMNQVWIMYMLECPLHTQQIREKYAFNWTATYRHDSDLVAPYEKWINYGSSVPRQLDQTNHAANKTKKVAWFVSNCAAKNNRLEYARELQKHIEVDIYGSCGTKQCSRHSVDQCFKMLAKEYKFYLAFENSNCRDYITEKFFVNGLGNNVLPIVMGAPRIDYERSAPHHSFIHVDDFASPKELAAYLEVLDKNDTLYNEYFRWKGTGQFINTYFFCRLCAMLHQTEHHHKTYEDFDQWWRGGLTCIKTSWRELEEYRRNKKKKQIAANP